MTHRTRFRHVRPTTLAKVLAWLGVIACLALAASTARAAVRSYGAAGDPQTTYTLHGRMLTISSTDPIVLQVVRDAHLLVMCESASPRAGAKLVYASTLADVAPGNVAAMIGQGSSSKRIEFAVRGLDGHLYVLRGRVGSSFSAVS